MASQEYYISMKDMFTIKNNTLYIYIITFIIPIILAVILAITIFKEDVNYNDEIFWVVFVGGIIIAIVFVYFICNTILNENFMKIT